MVTRSNGRLDPSQPVAAQRPSEPLLQHLVDAVRTLPREALPAGKGHLTLSVIFSPARVAKVLYPWAHLEDARSIGNGSKPFPSQTVKTWEEMIFCHAEWRRDDEDEDDPKMICGIEAYNYTLPDHASSVFYLSKLDTSGWGPRLQSSRTQRHLATVALDASPSKGKRSSSAVSQPTSPIPTSSLTGFLTAHFLSFFLARRHLPRIPVPCMRLRHVSLHILARAQAAYLFPNSPENAAKLPLTDAKLIVWWRETLSQVIALLRNAQKHEQRIDAYYMIPGLERLESHPLVPLPPATAPESSALGRARWHYGHPYTLASTGLADEKDLPPLPLRLSPGDGKHGKGIATLLPRFEDDPQSRFLDELAGEGQEIGRFSDLLKSENGPPSASADGASQSTLVTNDSQDSQTTLVASQPKPPAPTDASIGRADGRSDEALLERTPKKPRLASLDRVGSDSQMDAAVSPRRSPRNLSPVKNSSSLDSPLRTPRRGTTGSASAQSSPARNGGSSSAQAREGTRLTQAQLDALRSRLSLDSVDPDEFWVRMGFRQECSSGNLVGAFFVGVTASANADDESIAGVVEPQTRPTHTIPVRELQKTVRNCLQLDDCWWNKDRESIELTQEFDEERGRLLAHLGRLEEGKDRIFEGEDAWKNGRGIVWQSIPLEGYSSSQVDKAARLAKEELQREKETQAKTSQQKVTMLSVKRKKKA